jgi:hypothetical protein
MRHDDAAERPVDPLSPLARQVLALNAAGAYTKLIVSGEGNREAKELLTGARPEQMVVGPLANRDDAACVLAALYLWHDCLPESHTISQAINTPAGSFWHAILHRREGDFSNSKYWYARCAGHPALPTIAARANEAINPLPADKSTLRLTHGGWNTDAFVDLVEQVHTRENDPKHRLAIALQQVEWRVLFDQCVRGAAGT